MTLDAWEEEYAKSNPVWKGPPLYESPFPSGLDILELGCGNGKNIPALLKTASSVTAVDFSHNAVQLCREQFTDENISFVEADVCCLSFKDESFDAVCAIHILEHLSEKGRVQSRNEICRVLKPEGFLTVRVFSINDMRFGKGTEVEKNTFSRGNGIDYHYFTNSELKSLFSQLKLVSMEEIRSEKKYGVRSEISAIFRKY